MLPRRAEDTTILEPRGLRSSLQVHIIAIEKRNKNDYLLIYMMNNIVIEYKNVLILPVTSIKYHILKNIEISLTIAVVIFYILDTQNVKKT